MLKKTIVYEDFNGEEVREDHFFHLSKAELVELEMSVEGGFVEAMQKISADQNGSQIIREFKRIILMSYGKKSEDGRRFIKNRQLRDEFESSEAYSTLFMELVTNANAAVEFINGVIPASLAREAAELQRSAGAAGDGVVRAAPAPAGLSAPATITRAEILAMSPEALSEVGMKVAQGELIIIDPTDPTRMD